MQAEARSIMWVLLIFTPCSSSPFPRGFRYEIFTAADTPYSRVTDEEYTPDDGVMRNKDVKRFVCDGQRMACPPECSQDFYNEIIAKCWEASPGKRPSFAELEEKVCCFTSIYILPNMWIISCIDGLGAVVTSLDQKYFSLSLSLTRPTYTYIHANTSTPHTNRLPNSSSKPSRTTRRAACASGRT